MTKQSKVVPVSGKAEQRRDALLLKLLKAPPKPRPKREQAMPTRKKARNSQD